MELKGFREKHIMKRITAIIISFLLALSLLTGVVFADEEPAEELVVEIETEAVIPEAESIIVDVDITADDPEIVDNSDELLMEYMEISISDSNAPMNSIAALGNLSGINVKVYGLLKACVAKVARGDESSTVFTLYKHDLGLDDRYSAADLGVSAIISGGAFTDEGKTAMKAKLQEIDLNRVNTALQFDCPAEFYWYEKSVGCRMSISYGLRAAYDKSLGDYVIYFSDETRVTFSYTVAEDYAVNHAAGTYVVDSGVIGPIQTAISHANEIITTHASEDDYQKLVSYKDEICDAVAYNTAAGNSQYTYNYGNPWQLIWVFDENPATNVVCEGYAKAFQFLCDESAFNSDKVESRIVTGKMSGGTGAGGHMWNVVTMDDGLNYLVDVTNCDKGSIGYPEELFLAGKDSGSVSTRYSIRISGKTTMTFSYDEDTRSAYTEKELTLAEKDYTPPETPPQHQHDWEAWTVIKPATATTKGEETRTCRTCGEVETRAIPITGQLFDDVQNMNAWYYETVYTIASTKNVNGKALMSGYGDGSKFGPADPLTRQDFAVILYRLADEPEVPEMENPFKDTNPKGYYYTCVVWAKANDVIAGYSDGRFGVGDKITREQVATILYRFAKDYKNINTSSALADGDLSKFKDKTAISSWAKEALTWATGAGVITGKDNGTRIDARGNAVRAEIGAMILRFIEYMNHAQ